MLLRVEITNETIMDSQKPVHYDNIICCFLIKAHFAERQIRQDGINWCVVVRCSFTPLCSSHKLLPVLITLIYYFWCVARDYWMRGCLPSDSLKPVPLRVFNVLLMKKMWNMFLHLHIHTISWYVAELAKVRSTLMWKMMMFWKCVESHSNSSSLSKSDSYYITFFYALSGGRCSQEFITVMNSLYSIVLCNCTHDKPV